MAGLLSLLTPQIAFPIIVAQIPQLKYISKLGLRLKVWEFLAMGNCSLKGVTKDCYNPIRVLSDSGAILQFRGPITAKEILNDHPGYGIFPQGLASSPLQELDCLIGGRLYHLLPLVKDCAICNKLQVNKQVQNRMMMEQLEAESMSVTEQAKRSMCAASDVTENLADGSALEVLPSVEDGVWRVKLVIDTKQLEEILSEQVNTEALIERMRMAAASSASPPPKQTKGAWALGMSWRPTLPNLFKATPGLDHGK